MMLTPETFSFVLDFFSLKLHCINYKQSFVVLCASLDVQLSFKALLNVVIRCIFLLALLNVAKTVGTVFFYLSFLNSLLSHFKAY